MSEPAAPDVAETTLEQLVAESRAGFAESFGYEPAVTVSAPGRINVIGEHTDYNQGLALPGAIDRWTLVSLAPRDGDNVVVESDKFSARATWPIDGSPSDGSPLWGDLVFGVSAVFFQLAGFPAGFEARITGNVPLASGISSSAAVEVALLGALRAAFGVGLDDFELVLAAQRVEHEHLGVATGLMDQYTSQFSRPGTLMLVDFGGPSHEHIAAGLQGWVWILVDTKVRRELAASRYGERVLETRSAFEQIVAADPTVTSFRDVREGHLPKVGDEIPRRRLLHYVRENERVRRAAAALSKGDIRALGTLMRESHVSLRDDYGVSCPELDCLVDSALAFAGCAGARMMGGGFGGCTINLVRGSGIDTFAAGVSPEFEARFGYAPEAAVYTLGGGACVH